MIGYLPTEAAALGEKRAEHLTVYQILQEYLGLRVARAEVTIRCQRPPRAIGKLLGLKTSEQALVMERTSFSQDQRACEFMRIHIVPERGADPRMKRGQDV